MTVLAPLALKDLHLTIENVALAISVIPKPQGSSTPGRAIQKRIAESTAASRSE